MVLPKIERRQKNNIPYPLSEQHQGMSLDDGGQNSYNLSWKAKQQELHPLKVLRISLKNKKLVQKTIDYR